MSERARGSELTPEEVQAMLDQVEFSDTGADNAFIVYINGVPVVWPVRLEPVRAQGNTWDGVRMGSYSRRVH